MRHNKKFNHLSRTSAHRKALLANMTVSLIMHKRIKTTLAKAKALRVYVEPIITRAKENTDHAHRMVFSDLQNKEAVKELFGTVMPKVGDRPGGYTRILKTGFRLGDNAQTCIIELVDFNEEWLGSSKKTDSTAGGKKTRRTRRSSGKKTLDEAPKTVDAEKTANRESNASADSIDK